jgi:hypothetical protein
MVAPTGVGGAPHSSSGPGVADVVQESGPVHSRSSVVQLFSQMNSWRGTEKRTMGTLASRASTLRLGAWKSTETRLNPGFSARTSLENPRSV